MARHRLALAGLVVGGLLVPLAALELVLRFAPSEPGGHDPVFDRPATFYYPDADGANPWLRGADPADVRTVSIVGDSFTVARHVPWDDGWPARLERLLNFDSTAPPVDVKLFARSGSSTSQQLRFLGPALELDPELLILALFLNDPEPGGGDTRAELRDRRMPSPPGPRLAPWVDRLRTVGWLYTRLERRRAHRAALEYYRFLYDESSEHWQRFVEAIGRFDAACEQTGTELAFVVFPGMGWLGPAYPHREAHAKLDRVLAATGRPVLDLLGPFEDKSPERMAVYPGVDNHPSEIAHRLAAETIYAWLLEEEILPAEHDAPRTDSRPAAELREQARRLDGPWFSADGERPPAAD